VRRSFLQSVGEHTLALAAVRVLLVVYVLLVYTPGEVLVCVLLVCTADGVKRSSLQSVGEHTLALAVVRDAHNMYDVM